MYSQDGYLEKLGVHELCVFYQLVKNNLFGVLCGESGPGHVVGIKFELKDILSV